MGFLRNYSGKDFTQLGIQSGQDVSEIIEILAAKLIELENVEPSNTTITTEDIQNNYGQISRYSEEAKKIRVTSYQNQLNSDYSFEFDFRSVINSLPPSQKSSAVSTVIYDKDMRIVGRSVNPSTKIQFSQSDYPLTINQKILIDSPDGDIQLENSYTKTNTIFGARTTNFKINDSFSQKQQILSLEQRLQEIESRLL